MNFYFTICIAMFKISIHINISKNVPLTVLHDEN